MVSKYFESLVFEVVKSCSRISTEKFRLNIHLSATGKRVKKHHSITKIIPSITNHNIKIIKDQRINL